MEKIVKELSSHDSRLISLEEYQKKQNGILERLENRINKLIWAFVLGEGAIIMFLIGILLKG